MGIACGGKAKGWMTRVEDEWTGREGELRRGEWAGGGGSGGEWDENGSVGMVNYRVNGI